jgi:hypothetical protein
MLRPILFLVLPALVLWPFVPKSALAQSVVQEREYDQCIVTAMRQRAFWHERP